MNGKGLVDMITKERSFVIKKIQYCLNNPESITIDDAADAILAELQKKQGVCEWTKNGKHGGGFPLFDSACGGRDFIYQGGYCCCCAKSIKKIK